MKHKHFKNPNWWEAYQLAIYKCDWGFEHGTTVPSNKFKWSERMTRTRDLQRPYHSATPFFAFSKTRHWPNFLKFLNVEICCSINVEHCIVK